MRFPKLKFDRLQIFAGEPKTIDIEGVAGTVTVKSPTMGDIIKIGEGRFYSTLSILVGNTTQARLILWNSGIDWCVISDFVYFTMRYKELDKEVVDLLFDDINFEDFDVYTRVKDDGSEEIFLYNEKTGVEITELVYQYFHQYLQNVFDMKPEEEITKDRHLKEWWIRKDSVAAAQKEKKDEDSSFSFVPLISMYINDEGTKHSLQDIKDGKVGVAEFFDSIKRIRVREHAKAVLSGIYSGFADAKNINPSEYDFARDI